MRPVKPWCENHTKAVWKWKSVGSFFSWIEAKILNSVLPNQMENVEKEERKIYMLISVDTERVLDSVLS